MIRNLDWLVGTCLHCGGNAYARTRKRTHEEVASDMGCPKCGKSTDWRGYEVTEVRGCLTSFDEVYL